MVLKNFTDLIDKVKASGITKKIVVVSADDAHTLEAVMEAAKDGIVEPVFIGSAEAIDVYKRQGLYHPQDEGRVSGNDGQQR